MLPLLRINHLQVDFITEGKKTTAVDDITFMVNRGEVVGIAGESGSGKSVTSLSILKLLPSPPAHYTQGEILFAADGLNIINMLTVEDEELRSIRGKQISMIFQEPMTSLNPVFTCGDQVMESIRLHQRISFAEAEKKTIALFDKVKLPDPANIFHRYPHQLSGGQKQRVMIAIAMSGNPSLLICDEPTTALDVTVQKTVLQLIKDLQKESGMGVIFITHDLGVIAEIADRVIIMQKGSIVEQGTVQQVFTSPRHDYTKALLACRPALYPKGVRLPVVKDFTQNLTERQPTKQNIPAALPDSKILLNVTDLKVWFPAQKTFIGKPFSYIKAVDGVSFSIFKGETLGLVGESGSGKTTLGRALLRLVEPTSGRIEYEGIDLLALNSKELKNFRKNIQIIFQDPYSSLNPSLKIGAAIEETLKIHSNLNTKQRKEKVLYLLEKVNLDPSFYHRYPHEFSGGQRQRVVIARTLAVEPTFIVCDESVSALDVSIQAQVLNLLNDLKEEFAFTTIFISHDLSVVRYLSDRIMVMEKGKIAEIGPAEEVYLHPGSIYTRKLLESLPRAILPGTRAS